MPAKFYPLAFLIPVVFLFTTNRWLPWKEAHDLVQASDVSTSYEPIALASPSFPQEKLFTHQAQRFVLPYLIGGGAKLLHVPMETAYRLASLLLVAAILTQVFLALGNGPGALLGFSLFVLNPYALRYYLVAPGMAPDLFFIFAVA